MPHLSPVSEEIISVVYQVDEPTVEKIDQETSRPRSLIEGSVNERLNRRFLSVDDDGKLVLTDAGRQAAEQSPLTN
jgi:hypothetical protein